MPRAPVQRQIPVLPFPRRRPGGGHGTHARREEGVRRRDARRSDHVGPDRARRHDEDDTQKTVSTQYSVLIQQTRDVDSMLGQRRRRWTNIELTLGQHIVFAGMHHTPANKTFV